MQGQEKIFIIGEVLAAQIYQPLVSPLGQCLNPLIGYRYVCLTFSATPIFETSETGYISVLYFLQIIICSFFIPITQFLFLFF